LTKLMSSRIWSGNMTAAY